MVALKGGRFGRGWESRRGRAGLLWAKRLRGDGRWSSEFAMEVGD